MRVFHALSAGKTEHPPMAGELPGVTPDELPPPELEEPPPELAPPSLEGTPDELVALPHDKTSAHDIRTAFCLMSLIETPCAAYRQEVD